MVTGVFVSCVCIDVVCASVAGCSRGTWNPMGWEHFRPLKVFEDHSLTCSLSHHIQVPQLIVMLLTWGCVSYPPTDAGISSGTIAAHHSALLCPSLRIYFCLHFICVSNTKCSSLVSYHSPSITWVIIEGVFCSASKSSFTLSMGSNFFCKSDSSVSICVGDDGVCSSFFVSFSPVTDRIIYIFLFF